MNGASRDSPRSARPPLLPEGERQREDEHLPSAGAKSGGQCRAAGFHGDASASVGAAGHGDHHNASSEQSMYGYDHMRGFSSGSSEALMAEHVKMAVPAQVPRGQVTDHALLLGQPPVADTSAGADPVVAANGLASAATVSAVAADGADSAAGASSMAVEGGAIEPAPAAASTELAPAQLKTKIVASKWTPDEEQRLRDAVKTHGCKWAEPEMQKLFPDRSNRALGQKWRSMRRAGGGVTAVGAPVIAADAGVAAAGAPAAATDEGVAAVGASAMAVEDGASAVTAQNGASAMTAQNGASAMTAQNGASAMTAQNGASAMAVEDGASAMTAQNGASAMTAQNGASAMTENGASAMAVEDGASAMTAPNGASAMAVQNGASAMAENGASAMAVEGGASEPAPAAASTELAQAQPNARAFMLPKSWTPVEEQRLRDAVRTHGYNWAEIAKLFPRRSSSGIHPKWRRMQEAGGGVAAVGAPAVNWWDRKYTPDEVERLREAVAEHGESSWDKVAESLPGRTATSVRDKWAKLQQPKKEAATNSTVDADLSADQSGPRRRAVTQHWVPDDWTAPRELKCAEQGKPAAPAAPSAPGQGKPAAPAAPSAPGPARWTAVEIQRLRDLADAHSRDWAKVAESFPGRSVESLRRKWGKLTLPPTAASLAAGARGAGSSSPASSSSTGSDAGDAGAAPTGGDVAEKFNRMVMPELDQAGSRGVEHLAVDEDAAKRCAEFLQARWPHEGTLQLPNGSKITGTRTPPPISIGRRGLCSHAICHIANQNTGGRLCSLPHSQP